MAERLGAHAARLQGLANEEEKSVSTPLMALPAHACKPLHLAAAAQTSEDNDGILDGVWFANRVGPQAAARFSAFAVASHSLLEVTLSKAKLSEFPPQITDELRVLQRLDLRDNVIKTVPRYTNSFHCNGATRKTSNPLVFLRATAGDACTVRSRNSASLCAFWSCQIISFLASLQASWS
jgi:hypothetical protein